MNADKERQNNKIKRPRSGLHFDIEDDKATKYLVVYMKWWLIRHPVEDKKFIN